jgi:His-Xaa-Ser system radical SAM maturase HxsC
MCPYTEKFRLSASHEQLDLLCRYVDLMDPCSDYLCITGGEPTLLKDDFIRLMEKVKTHFQDTIVHILTNGRAFYYDDFLTAYKKARPYKTLLGIPLHASAADLHDHITQSQGSFAETIKGIDSLYMSGEHIELRIVTSALNYENLPQLAELVTKRYPHVYRVCFMGLEMMGNSMINRTEVWCSYDKIWPYIRQSVDVLLSHGVPIQLYNYPLCMIDRKYHSLYKKSITPSKIEYFDACYNCCRINECGGFFRTTRIIPDIKVIPYMR